MRNATWKIRRPPMCAPFGNYQVRNRGGITWYSTDGQTWTDSYGNALEPDECITLHGGPKDGFIRLKK